MAIDVGIFTTKDAFEIGLQRTTYFRSKLAFRLWTAGFPLPLRIEASLRKGAIIRGALDDAEREFEVISQYLGDRPIKRMADIGCGHALIDVYFWGRFQCAIHLIDIEATKSHHHDYQASGSGYASLSSARAFLETNGVPNCAIQTSNPEKTEVQDVDCELVISLLSCGFHYPATTYTKFLLSALKKDGVFIFDMRKESGQDDFLSQFARFEVIKDAPKYRRIAAIKG